MMMMILFFLLNVWPSRADSTNPCSLPIEVHHAEGEVSCVNLYLLNHKHSLSLAHGLQFLKHGATRNSWRHAFLKEVKTSNR